jgi:hypothetical protein
MFGYHSGITKRFWIKRSRQALHYRVIHSLGDEKSLVHMPAGYCRLGGIHGDFIGVADLCRYAQSLLW